MNERIEKFARECGAWNQVYGNRTFMIDEHFDIEKFAELIAADCASVADLYAMPDGTSATAMAISKAIQLRYGIEQCTN
jgi:hypothetical protein